MPTRRRLSILASFPGCRILVVRSVRNFIPKETIAPDVIVGMDEIVADAVKNKFVAPLTPAQITELVQIPKP